MAGNYNSYNPNYYVQDLQGMRDRIDRTIQSYQQNQNQFANQQQQQPQIQQTFQLAPNQNNSGLDAKLVSNIDEVKSVLVWKPTLFVNNDYSMLWIKDVNGNIRTFRTEEIVQVDENIQEINNLKQELADIKTLLLQQAQVSRQLPENPKPLEEPKQEKKISKK